MEIKKNYFQQLNDINVNGKTEQKNHLTYLSWAWAWAEVKKLFPDATYTIYENRDEWNYFTDGKTCWVKTGVTINGIEHIEELPVMDYKNQSIPLDKVTSFDVNKAIQRSLTKACARHGLGLYIYAGEDLPESEKPEEPKAFCADCGLILYSVRKKDGSPWEVADQIKYSEKRYGRCLCAECMKKAEKAEKESK